MNFLFDEQSPHLTAREVYAGFAEASFGIGMGPFDSEWTLPSLIDANPAAWMVIVNGIVVDVRTMPRELQEAAYSQGLIPHLPKSTDET